MFGQPPPGAAYLGNDAIEPGRRSQRVFDDREIDPERQQAVGEKGETLLVVHLPVAAVDKRKRRRSRIGGEKQIEPLARSLTEGEVERPGVSAPPPAPGAPPMGNIRSPPGTPGGFVVGG